ncbi:MAG TPA: nuclear transport factor 2 family protein [Porticoccus sp.]|nr:nuclear transport factor 2 family protein [Porticoccus sp.]
MNISKHPLALSLLFCSLIPFALPTLASAEADNSNTRATILSMEKECTGKLDKESAVLKKLAVQCRPYVDHGGASTPEALDETKLSADQKSIMSILTQYVSSTKEKNSDTLGSLLTEDFVIIQPGGNAWNKQNYLEGGVAHLFAMFTELSFDIEPIRINTTDTAATVIATFRLGGLHMGKPATTFGLGTINLVKKADQWKIQHIHNSGMQVY